MPGMGTDGVWDPLGLGTRAGWDVGDNEWNTDARKLEGSGSVMALTRGKPRANAMNVPGGGGGDFFGEFMGGKLPEKIATVLALLVVSRIGTYIPISGVDRAAFAESLAGGGGMLGYVDTLTGGSISKLGIFSLGIVPFINSSIIFQVRRVSRIRSRPLLRRRDGGFSLRRPSSARFFLPRENETRVGRVSSPWW